MGRERPSFEELMKVFDFLASNNLDLEYELIDFFTEEQRTELYKHPFVEEFDILP